MKSLQIETRATVVHENKSQGVLYEFHRGPRVWNERQRRGLVVGGEYDGQRMTRWEITSSKWAPAYFQYNKALPNSPENFLWIFLHG